MKQLEITAEQAVGGSAGASLAGQKVQLFSGWDTTPQSQRGQIYDRIRAALPPQVEVKNLWGTETPEPGAVSVSLFSYIKADVLVCFDLADRNELFGSDAQGRPAALGFSKLLVPGRWHRDRLLNDHTLGLQSHDIVVTGSPRVDHLRALQAQTPPAEASNSAKPVVLYAPMHEDWRDVLGQPISSTQHMLPYLDRLREQCELIVQADQPDQFNKEPATETLLAADVVITDYAAVMYEAWALGKPVIFPRWLLKDRIFDAAPGSAEAHVYETLIGHHAESFEQLLGLISQGRDLECGPGVAPFMEMYLDNHREGNSAESIAALLTHLSDPLRAAMERDTRNRAAVAIEDNDWATASACLSELLIWNSNDVELLKQQARAYEKTGKPWLEIEVLEQAVRITPGEVDLHLRLAVAARKLGRHHTAARAYSAAIQIAPDDAKGDWYYQLGFVLETPGIDGDPVPHRAAEAYDRAIELDTKSQSERFGVGALHTRFGRWQEAIPAFEAHISQHPLDAELYYRLGMANDRCYHWKAAESAYRRAVALETNHPHWHYRLGFVLERQALWNEAAEAYSFAAALSKKTHHSDWYYRAGYVLEKAGRFEDACAAYVSVPAQQSAPQRDVYQARISTTGVEMCEALINDHPEDAALWKTYSAALEARGDVAAAADALAKAALFSPVVDSDYFQQLSTLQARASERKMLEARLDRDCTRPDDWLRYSEILEADQDLPKAVEAMRQAVMRSNAHAPLWHHRLGLLLAQDGRFQDAARAFRDQQILQRPHGIYDDKFESSPALRETATYRELYETTDVLENTVVYESYSGVSLSCSPYALFRKISENPDYAHWTHIWVVKPDTTIPEEMRAARNIIFVERDSYLYMRYLATAQHLVNNATFPYYFICRDEQKYLNTWHGTPLKYLGADIKDEPLARANTVRNLLQCTHIIHPNEHTCRVMTERNLVGPSLTADVKITGYPRIDTMLNATETEKADLRRRLGIGSEERVVLFAPSYRGYWSSPEIEADQLVATLEKLNGLGARVLFRGHYFAEQMIRQMKLPVDVVSSEIDSCLLLSITDILITDYSSIFYDFLPSRRPILHLVEDWDTYEETRGVYFGKEELPGTVCEDTDQLLEALQGFLSASQPYQPSPRHAAAIAEFSSLEDGRSTERVLEFWLGDSSTDAHSPAPADRPSIGLYIGSVDKNGITASASSLISNLAAQGYPMTAFVNRPFIGGDEGKITRMRDIGNSAEVIIRTGRNCTTTEEQWLTDKFNAQHYLYSEEQYQTMFHGMALECRRSFGRKTYDLTVDFDGYSPFLTNLMGMISSKQKAAMLHNEMYSEMTARFPHLRRAFLSYRHFDKLVSVSDSVAEVNRKDLSERFGISQDTFAVAPNTIDIGRIARLAEEPIDDPDLEILRQDSAFRIINLARLSPEKNQRQLIQAVRLLKDRGHDVSAYILGKGPLQNQLEKAILDHGLSGTVHLLGVKENPYPFLKLADAHALSSSYEGQGIVLLEAMMLGVPCVSTDIPGPRSVLNNGLGILTPESPEALADGIEQVIKGRFAPAPFDPETYNSTALSSFLEAVGLT